MTPQRYAARERPSRAQNTRPTIRPANRHWAQFQEFKMKVEKVPREVSTLEIYNAYCRHGNIVRIEKVTDAAYIVFRPPPRKQDWLHPESEFPVPWQIRFLPSPIDPYKKYPELNVIRAHSIDFGITISEGCMMRMQNVTATYQVQFTLNLSRKRFTIEFPLSIGKRHARYKFESPIQQLQQIFRIDDHGKKQCHLVIPYKVPPRFFKFAEGQEELSKTFSPSEKIWYENHAWLRQTDVVDGHTMTLMNAMPVMNMKNAPIIDIGRWTTYRVSFSASVLDLEQFADFSNALADHGVAIQNMTGRYRLIEKSAAPLWDLVQEEYYTTHPKIDPFSTPQQPQSTFDDLFGDQIYLTFPVRYQLDACLSNGFLQEHTITREFLERLLENPQALGLLERVMDKQMVLYNPMDLFNIRLKNKGNLTRRIPGYCFLARAVNITPTMMHVATPAIETSNRIIRKNATDADRFIRVKFTDEKTEGRLPNQGISSEALFKRVTRALEQGIVVAGRYYVFLAFGNSQFREHSAYFYAPTATRSADDIRRALGTFDHIKTPAKFGARLGQCFSTTRHITSSKSLKIEMIKDIERNGFAFTDGVGKISLFLAKMAAQELGLQNAFEDPPSAYQFRLAGCKGVLVLDPKIHSHEVHIRKSQYKFKAEFDGLEIIRASAFTTAYFNRQLILVLSTLGVPDQVFVQKQQEWIDCLELVTKDETVALGSLQRNVDINQMSLTMAGMILDGFMYARDPFVMSLLHLWRAYNIKTLKEKARIVIEKGAFVLGCVDETATLRGHFDSEQNRPGLTRQDKLAIAPEIFLRVSDTTKPGHYKVITGVCILARNPSLHAGDVRVVRAVDVPALHHLKNVVVLPQSGDRDLGNMCSGGDLDGDDYLVMWDEDFVPITINEEPMDFTPDKPTELDRAIKVKDLTDFFVNYMKNDSLGQIAHAHLAQADFSDEGVRDYKCLELAKLHSQAVDYPKSGIPAVMSRELKPSKWPHFMEKEHLSTNKIYRSTRVLGQLYDKVELVDFKPQYNEKFDSRVLNAFELSKDMLAVAKTIKADYDAAMRRLMAKHGIRTEFEVWSIFVLAHNQPRRDYKFAEEFGATVEAVKYQHRDACRKAAGGNLLQFVAAMYTVTARELEDALEQEEEKKEHKTEKSEEKKEKSEEDSRAMTLISFPWLFYRELGMIATGSRRQAAFVQQAHVNKTKRPTVGVDSEAVQQAEVETKQGVTHYGELLDLEELMRAF